ncbi:MAG: Single-stranded-DNA-specific exonuclease RecJ [uncultured bacterium]|uniref:Single-stranded-DNA-specific exonuclease RecJ n=1 Tax=Candidatus Uhrbacteria bacterium GW2011_GWC1_41_20 TaxID=1618983 RepID=A0A0G0VHB2_9BACT|nr:MAG: Single-stranded-DNA-specific exonuclease RecJ [uncultured bacterium]KKR22520.1 MAG: Single-stranded-DNA-specific exonuclease RecJ [Candidatus Uhrbacteria bacterium GW2011_GWE1_39_46]KKR63865.1 MAG: Single-stranded-DNA-specific exonuclease RecJ [Candidatus Uhrbacteria bacterium GW2011_GWC2_40_450]KKR90063.1 MAG: Single-stranded-DNA-specific exonuclease RecJ [Candidatus Uhrbacteria bacterium GW2011_GWD2_41_121]KKR90213.1 MAG: Single-stranded-DNA-specific exonuclease RecJ [Candidatus Uhrba
MKYNWNIQLKKGDDLIGQLLANRSIGEHEQEAFFHPKWDDDIHDPFLFKQMQSAVDRTMLALQQSETIVVHGDYDADGICGSTLIMDVLEYLAKVMSVELNASAFLPHRERDGYGVALHTVDSFIKDNIDLLITVDCGIANSLELDHAHDFAIDVIICDHHQLAPDLPSHAIIIHPLAPGEIYPNKKLCGTGVAFKFACALLINARRLGIDVQDGYEKWLLDLVAIATVTDVVPLLGENRVLETFGLKVLNRTRRPGLLNIIQNSNVKIGKIGTEDIGFRIGPRLNAAGRLREAQTAFNALNAKDLEAASAYSTELEMLNRERQRLSNTAYEEARLQLVDIPNAFVHVVYSEAWTPGIVGLVAGKIAYEFNAATFALTKSGDQYLGSGRSARGLHLVEAMRSCGDIFIKAGGHPEACGLTLESMEMVNLFREKVNEYAKKLLGATDSAQELNIEAELMIEQVNFALYDIVQKFEPFGTGNPTPIFCVKDVVVSSVAALGNEGKHLKLKLESRSDDVECIGFGFGKLASQIKIGSKIDLAFKLRINEWQNQRRLQAEIVDVVIK